MEFGGSKPPSRIYAESRAPPIRRVQLTGQVAQTHKYTKLADRSDLPVNFCNFSAKNIMLFRGGLKGNGYTLWRFCSFWYCRV